MVLFVWESVRLDVRFATVALIWSSNVKFPLPHAACSAISSLSLVALRRSLLNFSTCGFVLWGEDAIAVPGTVVVGVGMTRVDVHGG